MQESLFDLMPDDASAPLSVEPLGKAEAAGYVVEHHYLHRAPPISYSHGLFRNWQVKGVVTYGVPASRELQKSASPGHPDAVVELNRLWVADEMPGNTESWFVARSLRLMPPRIVVSYADPAYGHVGYIYRALNFHYAGWTDMERKTPRFDYMPLDPAKHSRDAMRNGFSGRQRRIAKVKYWTVTGSRADRRGLAKMCGWPSLDWKTLPPPLHPQAIGDRK